MISDESDRRKISESAAAVICPAWIFVPPRIACEKPYSTCSPREIRSALEGTVWVDLYAGTGAVGIEAISRGASMVHFVESCPNRQHGSLEKTWHRLGIETGFQILKQDSIRALRTLASIADFIFLDPPYEMEEAYQQALEKLSTSSLLKDESIVIAEHHKKFEPGEIFGPLRRYRKLVQGDAVLSFYRLAAD